MRRKYFDIYRRIQACTYLKHPDPVEHTYLRHVQTHTCQTSDLTYISALSADTYIANIHMHTYYIGIHKHVYFIGIHSHTNTFGIRKHAYVVDIHKHIDTSGIHKHAYFIATALKRLSSTSAGTLLLLICTGICTPFTRPLGYCTGRTWKWLEGGEQDEEWQWRMVTMLTTGRGLWGSETEYI